MHCYKEEVSLERKSDGRLITLDDGGVGEENVKNEQENIQKEADSLWHEEQHEERSSLQAYSMAIFWCRQNDCVQSVVTHCFQTSWVVLLFKRIGYYR